MRWLSCQCFPMRNVAVASRISRMNVTSDAVGHNIALMNNAAINRHVACEKRTRKKHGYQRAL